MAAKGLVIEYHDGLFDITSRDICYSRIENMFISGDGEGLQINNESMRPEIEKKCEEIHKAVVELKNLLEG